MEAIQAIVMIVVAFAALVGMLFVALVAGLRALIGRASRRCGTPPSICTANSVADGTIFCYASRRFATLLAQSDRPMAA